MATIPTNDKGILLCPVCGHDKTHVTGAFADMSGTGGRLDAVVQVDCEQGHTFEVVFHQHRGDTLVSCTEFAA